jgi:hypothetical protein
VGQARFPCSPPRHRPPCPQDTTEVPVPPLGGADGCRDTLQSPIFGPVAVTFSVDRALSSAVAARRQRGDGRLKRQTTCGRRGAGALRR